MFADPEASEGPSPRRATFILRLWRERHSPAEADPAETDPARSGWRGTVEYVQGGERRAAADLAGVLYLVETWLNALEPTGREP